MPVYLPTEPLCDREKQNRVALQDLAAALFDQLKEAGVYKRRIAPIEEHRDDPHADEIRKLKNRKLNPIDDF